MLAAAMIWTAHPQSMDAMAEMEPIVFASANKKSVSTERSFSPMAVTENAHPTIQESRLRHLGDE